MEPFIGRTRELAVLKRALEKTGASRFQRPGRALLIRGRRRVGKSRLAEEFIRRARLPHVYYTATGQTLGEELRTFSEEVRTSDLPDAATFGTQPQPRSWLDALTLLARTLPEDSPSIVVIDELPYLIKIDPSFESVLQKVFDKEFSKRPVLLLLIGSDLSMMEAINTYDRPFYQRAVDFVVNPLTPHDLGQALSLPAVEAFDAHLVSGGLPMICEEWPVGGSLWDYLEQAVANPLSALIVSGERGLAAEFPPEALARQVLTAVGSGQRTHANIAAATRDISRATMNRALQLLVEKRMIAVERPLSTRPSRETRYHVIDTHLRFWIPFIGARLTDVERGRGDRILERIRKSWTSWRGMAVEPLIRESLRRMDGMPEGTGAVGGYWTRTNDPEIDLVGTDREPVAKKITMVGSIKWLENRPFDHHDLSELIVHRSKMPGADTSTPLYAVSRSGCDVEGVRHVTPEELLDAWR
ncbi:ATP-binding protein [Nonomuraea cavernae]|uniref:ATPase AAA n=1 Tax=Nonomuraea cavernae TaxID=2045107 RepID=A0A917ZH17_9ACTN|nr:ATP-binding protein [Nonomuraea cavernae]MCA2189953.1 ATP-binding protein [Nonomuraea cavernae]GGO82546.1 ATPase AAA [Nonomuraea cavernae]